MTPPTEHHCVHDCVCPIHGTPLIWWPAGRDHACQDVDCSYGHGMAVAAGENTKRRPEHIDPRRWCNPGRIDTPGL